MAEISSPEATSTSLLGAVPTLECITGVPWFEINYILFMKNWKQLTDSFHVSLYQGATCKLRNVFGGKTKTKTKKTFSSNLVQTKENPEKFKSGTDIYVTLQISENKYVLNLKERFADRLPQYNLKIH